MGAPQACTKPEGNRDAGFRVVGRDFDELVVWNFLSGGLEMGVFCDILHMGFRHFMSLGAGWLFSFVGGGVIP